MAVHASRLWVFIQDLQEVEGECFGAPLAEYGTEIKGSKLLDMKRFDWDRNFDDLPSNDRHKGVRRFLRRLQDYYRKTHFGRQRTRWVVPTPLFVDSKLAPAVQAADLCLYCINWGFRIPNWNFYSATRQEIAARYGAVLSALQFKGDGYKDGETFRTFGVVFVPDSYETRT